MNPTAEIFARALSDVDISAQFEGLEIVFSDKQALFPVALENAEPARRAGALRLVQPEACRCHPAGKAR
jgi:hypothetical protein